MAVRIEFLLIFIFVLLMVAIFGFNPISKEATSLTSDKEITFENSFFYNIKKDDSGFKIYAKKATKYKSYAEFYDMKVSNAIGDRVVAQRATYRDDSIFMKEGVELTQSDGSQFSTENLTYKIKKKLMVADKAFLLDYNRSIIKGVNLKISLNDKSVSADKIEAHIWFGSEP